MSGALSLTWYYKNCSVLYIHDGSSSQLLRLINPSLTSLCSVKGLSKIKPRVRSWRGFCHLLGNLNLNLETLRLQSKSVLVRSACEKDCYVIPMEATFISISQMRSFRLKINKIINKCTDYKGKKSELNPDFLTSTSQLFPLLRARKEFS